MRETAAAGVRVAVPMEGRTPVLDDTTREYARLAASLLDAVIGAIQLAPSGATVAYEAGKYNDGPRYEATLELASAIVSQLWYARAPIVVCGAASDSPGHAARRLPAGVRACLAAPLVGPSGRFLGAICVADSRARDWSDEELDRVRVLAATVSQHLEATPRRSTPAGTAETGAPAGPLESAKALLRSLTTASSHPLEVDAATEALHSAVEELRTSVEELQVMNEELLATRYLVDMERAHYRELFERVPHPYLITDRDGMIREANDAAVTLLGARRSQLIGKPLAVFIPEDGRSAFRTRLRELRGGDRQEWSLHLTPRGGSPRPLVCAASSARSRESDAERIYWLFQEPSRPEASFEAPHANGAGEGRDVAAGRSQDFEEFIARATARPGVPVVEQLRELIAGAHDTGSLQVGQRLPSIRAIADRFGVTSYAALQAYASLESERVVERRERSGVYVAPVDWPAPPRLPETAEWLATVLTQACEHQLRVPQLPDLVRRWTSAVAVRCACIESVEDSLVALSHELGSRFGVTAVQVPIAEALAAEGSARRSATLPAAIRDAQVLVTTPFHASQVRAIAEATGKPMLVATVNREIVDAIDAHLADHDLTVVCVDRGAGERIRGLHGGAFRDRIRVVLADEVEAAGLDAAEPVFVTLAARQRLAGRSLRLIAPPSPSFSLDFARKVSETLLRLNLDGARG